MNPSTTVGRYPLSTRFTANVRLAYVGYPEKESLYSIYTALNRVVLARSCAGSATWDTLKAAEKLATCMVDIFKGCAASSQSTSSGTTCSHRAT